MHARFGRQHLRGTDPVSRGVADVGGGHGGVGARVAPNEFRAVEDLERHRLAAGAVSADHVVDHRAIRGILRRGLVRREWGIRPLAVPNSGSYLRADEVSGTGNREPGTGNRGSARCYVSFTESL